MNVVNVKVRRIGTSLGVIIPKEELSDISAKEGSNIGIVILPEKKDFSAFGMAKKAKFGFKRDESVREF
jgi:antitoxin component of MazEF toxin-antitoxin module